MNFGTKHIKIKIYPDDHPAPHCHIERSNGEVTRVLIPTLIILSGPSLSKVETNLVLDRLDDLCDYFDQLHPKKY